MVVYNFGSTFFQQITPLQKQVFNFFQNKKFNTENNFLQTKTKFLFCIITEVFTLF